MRDAGRARYEKASKKRRRRSKRDADRSETQKEPGGAEKALNPSGLVSTNATLIMLKQEEQFKRLNSLGLI